MPAAAILNFFRSQICNGLNGHDGRTASPCRISLKSLKLRPRYGDFSFFQNGGGRHVGRLKLQSSNSSNCGTHHKCRIALPCHISWGLVKPLSRYLDFGFFKMAAAAILDFRNIKFFTVKTVKMVELHQHAKCRQNRLNSGRDMAIFRFFQDGGRPPSWICYACVGTTHEGHLVVFITVQNLVGIDAVFLIICTFFDFATLDWKRLFTPQNWGVWEFLTPKWGAMWKNPQKGTSLRESASCEPYA